MLPTKQSGTDEIDVFRPWPKFEHAKCMDLEDDWPKDMI